MKWLMISLKNTTAVSEKIKNWWEVFKEEYPPGSLSNDNYSNTLTTKKVIQYIKSNVEEMPTAYEIECHLEDMGYEFVRVGGIKNWLIE